MCSLNISYTVYDTKGSNLKLKKTCLIFLYKLRIIIDY